MRRIALVGSRHRGWQDGVAGVLQRGSPEDGAMVRHMLQEFRQRYPQGFYLLTIGCDAGFGRMVKEACEAEKVGLMEAITQFNSHMPKPHFELLHLARHAALLDVAQEFHIFVTRSRISNIEDLVSRLKGGRVPYFLYNERCEVVESLCPETNSVHT
jgi:hypothetical protein